MTAGKRVGHRPELVLDQQQPRRAILHQHRDLGRGQPPVQRHEDRPDADAGEVQGEEIEAVPGQHGHPLADRVAERLLQVGAAAVDPPIELGVAEPQPRGEVADSQPAGLHPAPVRDGIDHTEGIVGGHGQGHLSSSARPAKVGPALLGPAAFVNKTGLNRVQASPDPGAKGFVRRLGQE